jgi:hypothetical protein
MVEGESERLKERLYEALLKKYKDLINNSEKKTVGEVKGLIDKNDLTIQMFISRFKPEHYDFESQFMETAKKCYDFLIQEVDYYKLGFDLNFWLKPEEILKFKIADDEDLAVFLCSSLYALGNDKAEVLICEMDDFSTHAITIAEFKGAFMILDASQKQDFGRFKGQKESVLEEYSFEGKKIKRPLYKFNHQSYEQFV